MNSLPAMINRHLVILLGVVVFFEISNVDMLLQQWFFDSGIGSWLIERNEQPWRFIFYDGIKKVFALIALGLFLAVTLGHRYVATIADRRRELSVVLLTMIIVPLVVNFLKWYTDIPCPRDIRAFGGDAPYVTLFEHYPSWFLHDTSLRCYPAGHASGGFALMSLFFLFKQRRQQLQGLAVGVGLGWITGLYKMAIGDHFFSHTLVSMLLAWVIACIVAYTLLRDKRLDTETEAEQVQEQDLLPASIND